MTYIIPSQSTKQIRQLNNNDLLGELAITKNINLDDEGYIALSSPAVAIYTTDNDADFRAVDTMFQSSSVIWIPSQDPFAGINIGKTSLSNRSTDTNAPTSGYEEDGVYFNGTDVISNDSSIKYRSAFTTWTTVSLSLDSNFSTSMHNFDAVAGLMVGNSNIVKLINQSWATAVTLTLPVDYSVTSLSSNGSVGYIATRHNAGGKGKLFIWDGASTSADESYGFGGTEIYSLKEYDSSVACISSLGQLLRFNGGGFDELASLPVYFKGFDWSDDQNDHARVSDRGLIVDGDLIYIRLDSTVYNIVDQYSPEFVGGLWCYDPKVGLYCRNTPSYSRMFSESSIGTSNINTSTDTITFNSNQTPATGTPIVYDALNGTKIRPLKDGVCYFAIKTGTATMKLASSYANAIAGTAIDLLSTGNNSQGFLWYLMNDYGWTFAGDRGATIVLNTNGYSPTYAERVVMTAELFQKQDTTTAVSVLNVLQPSIPNRGYIVTPKLSSTNIQETYPTLLVKFKPLGADDKIIIKYRINDKEYTKLDQTVAQNSRGGTWTSTSTFTTTVDLSEFGIGEEIEIIGGVGAGHLAHISAIEESSGTYTVTLDEAFPTAVSNDLFYFVATNYKRLGTIDMDTKTASQQYAEVPLISSNNTSTFIQFKIELRGIGTTLSELQLSNKTFKKVL